MTLNVDCYRVGAVPDLLVQFLRDELREGHVWFDSVAGFRAQGIIGFGFLEFRFSRLPAFDVQPQTQKAS